MCGIVGAIDSRITENKLIRSISVLRHRGPDNTGVFLDASLDVGIGHSRLSIIDLKTGDQPLFSIDRNIALVCNGEIYDFERIREDLKRQNYRFRTKSDSEVIIYLYIKYGLEFFDHLRGEFSFLLLDRARKRLIACRDRFGIKPLYIATTDADGWIFASEVKAIFASGLKKAKIGLQNYFFNENGSFFRGVYNLPPATALIVNLNDKSVKELTYWKPEFPRENDCDIGKSVEDYKREIDDELTEAIRLRLRADVPVGLYLSGGIDSAIVAAKVCRLGISQPKAFTVSFTDMGKKYDEGRSAEKIATYVGVDQVVLSLDTETLWGNLEKCLWHVESPFRDFAPVGKFMLSDLARKDVKVILTGEGSDEIFLGYQFFRDFLNRLEHSGSSTFVSERIALLKALLQKFIRSLFWLLFFTKEYRPSQHDDTSQFGFSKQSNDRSQIDGRHPLIARQYKQLKTHLRNTILTAYGDRTEMAHSIEGRLPFLDHHLFNIAKQVPIEYKISRNREKHVVREIAKGLVPEEVLTRKKWPFSTPRPSLEKGNYMELDRILKTYLSKDVVRKAAVMKWSGIKALRFLRKFRFLQTKADGQLFFACCLQIIHSYFIEDQQHQLASDHQQDSE